MGKLCLDPTTHDNIAKTCRKWDEYMDQFFPDEDVEEKPKEKKRGNPHDLVNIYDPHCRVVER